MSAENPLTTRLVRFTASLTELHVDRHLARQVTPPASRSISFSSAPVGGWRMDGFEMAID
jgi:hypothetical protein